VNRAPPPILPRGPASAYSPPSSGSSASSPGSPPSVAIDRDLESFAISRKFDSFSTSEQLFYSTARRWRACDVYLDAGGTLSPAVVATVRVYAVFVGGIRSLISTGRYGHDATGIVASRWVAAARSVAARFEVTLEINWTGGPGSFSGDLSVAVCASDQAVEAPPWVGVIVLGGTGRALPALLPVLPDPELLWVAASSGPAVAAPRFLHVGSDAVLAPIVCLPIPMGGGGGLWPIGMRFRDPIRINASSTLSPTTVVGDCMIQAAIR